ncbi:FecR family protein [Novosphingobium sp. B 225]|uniref:FecR family protein n=1 Tax=Novosphingobium sp. B 225 TaxID=1961849 RepID=UPI0015963D1B|nr:FecR domain-containing protein [Novosphingobium sp. B 225]
MAVRILIRCGALLALGLTCATPALAQAVGTASAVVREAKLSNVRAPKPHQVALRERVAIADLVQTGKQSQLQLMLLDRSVFSIGANARLTIDRFVYDPARGRSMGATVAKGAFRFMSGRPNAMGGSSIGTPVATIGIRGTIVEGAIGQTAIDIIKGETIRAAAKDADKDNATLVVLRGPGAASQGDAQPGAISVASSGGTLDLTTPMLAAFVPRAGAAPVGPFTISQEGLLKLRDAIFPDLARDSGKTLRTLLGVGAAAAGVLGGGGGGSGGTTPNACVRRDPVTGQCY